MANDSIVRLLVREHSGLWYVDQGLMLRSRANEQKKAWNQYGFGCLILKWFVYRHSVCQMRIVPRPRVTVPQEWKETTTSPLLYRGGY
jgi:hypothetical protein